jgi:hypothetical protein
MQHVTNASSTLPIRTGVTRVRSSKPTLTWRSPAEHDIFTLNSDASIPDIVFEFASEFAGEYTWSWCIQWAAKAGGPQGPRRGMCLKEFEESGSFTSSEKRWKLDLDGKVLGGLLTVQVKVNKEVLTRTVLIKGHNPSPQQIRDYIATLDELGEFEDLFAAELKEQHFSEFDNEPVVTLDQRFGITHMAHWMPSYEQAWNWKANVLTGTELFAERIFVARDYLSMEGYAYTEEQLRNEALSRWRGGIFYRWDKASRGWVPRKKMVDGLAIANKGELKSDSTSDKQTQGQVGGFFKNGCCADYVPDQKS